MYAIIGINIDNMIPIKSRSVPEESPTLRGMNIIIQVYLIKKCQIRSLTPSNTLAIDISHMGTVPTPVSCMGPPLYPCGRIASISLGENTAP